MSNDGKWIAFLLRDKFADEQSKKKLKSEIIKRFGFKQSDICYQTSNSESGSFYYFFVKQYDKDNDMRVIHEAYVNIFQNYRCHTRVSQAQLDDLMDSVEKCNRGYVKFGDLVMINKGNYSKLYGIVLRQGRYGKYDVGLKFGFGTVIKSYEASDLTVTGNIFNYIKVLH